jgi:hypothetical protein
MGRPSSESLIRRLVSEVPALEPTLRAHLGFTDGEILSHPFFAEMTRQVQKWAGESSQRQRRDVRHVLGVLETALDSGDVDVDSLIGLSFIEALDPDGSGYRQVRAFMGPKPYAELQRYEDNLPGMGR